MLPNMWIGTEWIAWNFPVCIIILGVNSGLGPSFWTHEDLYWGFVWTAKT